jgi:prevent-host-death family protein
MRYTLVMKVTSTEFRKNLFQIVERVLQGELVEVAHKGRLIRLVPENKPSKLSRLLQRDTINGTLEDLERAQQQLDEELRASWDSKWDNKRFPTSTRT